MEFKETFGPKRDDEITLYTVAVGEINPFAVGELATAQDKAVKFINTLPGFVGVHPVIGRGTLLLFKTEQQAKEARKAIKAKGIQVGDNVTECYVPAKDLPTLQ